MKIRPSWDEYFLRITDVVASRTPCLRRGVGSIIVRDKQIISTGYNGPPSGFPHCKKCTREELGIPSGERLDICHAIHAEQNAIIQAAKHGTTVAGGTLYITTMPCSICAKTIANSGIEEVVYSSKYNDIASLEILHMAGVKVRVVKRNEASK